MARIRATRVRGNTRVSVSGRLAAADMGRLEHACGEALTRDPLQLHLDLKHVTEMDATAAAVVVRLRRRGAQVHTLAGKTASEESDDGNRRAYNEIRGTRGVRGT
jgi:anti-anti-sigma regulatory factor